MAVYPYLAARPWQADPNQTVDWVEAVADVELWLDQCIGQGNWCYEQDSIAFKRAEAKTLFLLRWN